MRSVCRMARCTRAGTMSTGISATGARAERGASVRAPERRDGGLRELAQQRSNRRRQVLRLGIQPLGTVGDGSTTDATSPVAVDLPTPITSVALGGSNKHNSQTIALADGDEYAWQ